MTKGIELTRNEAESLYDYLETGFIPYLADVKGEIDNMQWVYNICTIWKKCDQLFGKGNEDE